MTSSHLKLLVNTLASKDKNLTIFGAKTHQYKFGRTEKEEYLASFEKYHNILLPEDYRSFLKTVGNGGAGPFYGLFEYEHWNHELGKLQRNYLSTPFPHTNKWNMDFPAATAGQEDWDYQESMVKWEEEYFNTKHTAGSMRICHEGCGYYNLLVVTGPEAGHIWIDARVSDGGIAPLISKKTNQPHTFSTWYEEWLLESLEKLEGKT